MKYIQIYTISFMFSFLIVSSIHDNYLCIPSKLDQDSPVMDNNIIETNILNNNQIDHPDFENIEAETGIHETISSDGKIIRKHPKGMEFIIGPGIESQLVFPCGYKKSANSISVKFEYDSDHYSIEKKAIDIIPESIQCYYNEMDIFLIRDDTVLKTEFPQKSLAILMNGFATYIKYDEDGPLSVFHPKISVLEKELWLSQYPTNTTIVKSRVHPFTKITYPNGNIEVTFKNNHQMYYSKELEIYELISTSDKNISTLMINKEDLEELFDIDFKNSAGILKSQPGDI